MKPSIFDTAAYILSKFEDGISTMKLQKLCYYCQGWSLVWDEHPLFDEDFQAWMNGPVVHELYLSHMGKFSVTSKDIEGDPSLLSIDQKKSIDAVIDVYGKKSGGYLSQLTHTEKPWLDARGDLPATANCSKIISKTAMQDYYSSIAVSNES